jgi:hypothetical protein
MEPRFDFGAWCDALAEEVSQAEEEGLSVAVQRVVARFRDTVDAEAVAALAEELRRRYRIRGEDAQAAFRILEAYYWDLAIRRQPIRGRLKRYLASLLGYRYPNPVLLESDRVVFPPPMGADCPLLEACRQDVEKCRSFCQAHLEEGILLNPVEMMLVESAGPRVRWEIDEIRSTPDGQCHYVITSE